MSLSTKQLTDRLSISRERVEQWISRGYFTTAHNPGPGLAREWTLEDAIRLKATAELVEASLPASLAAHHAKYSAWGEHQPGTFLIVKFRGDGSSVGEVVNKDDLAAVLSASKTVIALNLDELRARVIRALETE